MIRIFIADDDLDDLMIFKTAVTELLPDSIVESDLNGDQLLLRLEKNCPPYPDLIFLDINMPKKDGYQTLEELKKNPDTRNIPVIILTTSNLKNDIEKMRQDGADYFITKPNSFQRLVHLVKPLLIQNSKEKDTITSNFYIV